MNATEAMYTLVVVVTLLTGYVIAQAFK